MSSKDQKSGKDAKPLREADSDKKQSAANPELSLRSLKLNDDARPPLRPGFGTKGATVKVFANYFELTQTILKPFHRYSLSIITRNENEQPKGKRLAQIIKRLLLTDLSHVSPVSDFRSTLITTKKLDSIQSEYTVNYTAEDDLEATQAKQYRVRVQFNATLDPNDYLRYLTDGRLDLQEPPNSKDIIQALNIMIGHGMKVSDDIFAQANKYIPISGVDTASRNLGPGLDAFRGCFLSVRGATAMLLLNAQVKNIAMYRPKGLEEIFAEFKAANFTPARAEPFLKGMKVKLTHFVPNRNKTISGFAHPGDGSGPNKPSIRHPLAKAHEIKFRQPNGNQDITVQEHFIRSYPHAPRSDSPVVNTGTRANPVYTLASVCKVQAGQPFSHRLDPNYTKNMIAFAVQKSAVNKEFIEKKSRALVANHSQSKLSEFGWIVGKSLIKVDARVLKSPVVTYAQDRSARMGKGSWNMTGLKFVEGRKLPKWGALYITPTNQQKSPQDLGALKTYVDETFRPFLERSGIVASEQGPVTCLAVANPLDCLSEVQTKFNDGIKSGTKLWLVILHEKSIGAYNAIKKAGDVHCGVHTICVMENKFYKAEPPISYFANVALKFNVKCGGRNQQLERGSLGLIADGKTMVVGLDVTHPAPGEDSAPSIAAMVTSVDRHYAQWPARIELQQGRQEMIQALTTMTKDRLKHWRKINKQLPSQILVYRDGVSEGQYDQVHTDELSQIKKACEETYPATDTKNGLPRITVVVVGKRHNTRFYPIDPKHNNTMHGTLVDRGVTESRVWDFFLQAHTPIQGTARPAHYVVIHDEIFRRHAETTKPLPGEPREPGKRAADHLEMITHNLCYLQVRSTKAVSIVPPAYYADLACERARRWLSRLFSDYNPAAGSSVTAEQAKTEEIRVHSNLVDTMFYI